MNKAHFVAHACYACISIMVHIYNYIWFIMLCTKKRKMANVLRLLCIWSLIPGLYFSDL